MCRQVRARVQVYILLTSQFIDIDRIYIFILSATTHRRQPNNSSPQPPQPPPPPIPGAYLCATTPIVCSWGAVAHFTQPPRRRSCRLMLRKMTLFCTFRGGSASTLLSLVSGSRFRPREVHAMSPTWDDLATPHPQKNRTRTRSFSAARLRTLLIKIGLLSPMGLAQKVIFLLARRFSRVPRRGATLRAIMRWWW